MDRNPVGWFEIPVADMDRAEKFYQEVLGYEMSRQEVVGQVMSWFPMHENAPFASGSLILHKTWQPSTDGTTVYFGVASIDAVLGKIEEHGGEVLLPKSDIGDHGWIAHIKDSEGNRIAIHNLSGE